METNQTIDNIQETTIFGLKGIFRISNFFKTFFKKAVSYSSLIIASIMFLLALFFKIDAYTLLCELKTVIINFLPGILGFTIAGYALIVGFVQNNMLNKITEKKKDSEFSLYQEMSSVFALNVILQGISLVFAFFIHFIVYFDTHSKKTFHLPIWYINIVNWVGMFLLSWFFIISCFLIIQIVVNIFNFSQLHHYIVNKEKIDQNQKKT
jgi:hypothetical protein